MGEFLDQLNVGQGSGQAGIGAVPGTNPMNPQNQLRTGGEPLQQVQMGQGAPGAQLGGLAQLLQSLQSSGLLDMLMQQAQPGQMRTTGMSGVPGDFRSAPQAGNGTGNAGFGMGQGHVGATQPLPTGAVPPQRSNDYSILQGQS